MEHTPVPNRASFLGSSDIGAVLGVSKWKTPLDVYMQKTGQSDEPMPAARQKVLNRGKRLEPLVIDMLAEELELNIIARNRRYIDAEYPFLACEVDAETEMGGERVNIEIKTSHPFAADQWGEEGSDEIDVSYAAQAMFSLMITGRARCLFGVLIGSDNLLTYNVYRDTEVIAHMRATAIDFWQEHVLKNIPPQPQNVDDVLKLFAADNGGVIEASPEIAAALSQLRTIKSSIKSYSEEKERVEFQIKEFISPNAILNVAGKKAATWKAQTQQRFDQERFKKEQPQMYEQYMHTVSFRALRLS